jgi:hypothetical protein
MFLIDRPTLNLLSDQETKVNRKLKKGNKKGAAKIADP